MLKSVLLACALVAFVVFLMPIPLQIASNLYWTAGFWAAVGAAVALAFLGERR